MPFSLFWGGEELQPPHPPFVCQKDPPKHEGLGKIYTRPELRS